ncbi:MAG: hypothetical protein RL264_1407 [Bacteroidota bacterium]
MINIFNLSLFFQLLAGSLPIAFFIFKKSNNNQTLQAIIILSFLTNLLQVTTHFWRINNKWSFILYLILGYILYSFYFFSILKNKSANLFLVLIPLFLVFFSIEYLGYNQFSNCVLFFIFIQLLGSLLYFISNIQSEMNLSKNNFHDLINGSIFIYATSTLFLFLILYFLMENHLWYIHNFIEGISKLIIAYAFWKLPKTSRI